MRWRTATYSRFANRERPARSSESAGFLVRGNTMAREAPAEHQPKQADGGAFRIKNVTESSHHLWSPLIEGSCFLPGQVKEVPDRYFTKHGSEERTSLREQVRAELASGRLNGIAEITTEPALTADDIVRIEEAKREARRRK
jgi:hypothetical protein